MRFLDFVKNMSPRCDQAGDLASLVTLLMYATSVNPISGIAVSTMLFANIYNTLDLVIKGVSPRVSDPIINTDLRAKPLKHAGDIPSMRFNKGNHHGYTKSNDHRL